MMQHRGVTGEPILIRDFADLKQENQRKEAAIRISHLSMASRRIVADYPENAGWYCLRVKDRQEFAVEKSLAEGDVIALVVKHPCEIVVRRGRQWMMPERAWLPGYVLVRIVPSGAAWHGLRSVKYVTDIVGSDCRFYRIPDKVIEKFIEYTELSNAEKEERKAQEREFLKGQVIRVINGPFASFEGVVLDDVEQGAERMKVEVSIFGRATPFEIDIASVQKL